MKELKDTLQVQLKEAESAEREVNNQKALADAVPILRKKVDQLNAEEQHQADRERNLIIARENAKAIQEAQKQVPELVKEAAKSCQVAYTLLFQIRRHYDQIFKALQNADYNDYQIDLFSKQDELKGRMKEADIIRTVADEHGIYRVKQLLEEILPDFDYLKGVNQSDAVIRDTAQFLLSKACPNLVVKQLDVRSKY